MAHDRVMERYTCERYGHPPPLVEHLRGHYTRISCPRCGKAVMEYGLEDHPQATKDPK
jgi:hypothetical protein